MLNTNTISDNCNCDNFTLKNKNVYYAIFDAEIFCQIPSIHSLLDLSNYPCAYCVFYVRCIAAAIEVTLLKYISWVHSSQDEREIKAWIENSVYRMIRSCPHFSFSEFHNFVQ